MEILFVLLIIQVLCQAPFHNFPSLGVSMAAATDMLEHPTSRVVALEDNVTLSCLFNGTEATERCYWIMDGDLIEMGDRYHIIGHPADGNCSLQINGFRLLDVGFWHCGLPRTDKHITVKSGYAELTTNSSSGLPGLYWMDELQNVEVFAGETAVLKCLVDMNATLCHWTKDGLPRKMRKNLQSRATNGNGSVENGIDCSIVLMNVSLEHDGHWQCAYGSHSSKGLTQVQTVQLKVYERVSSVEVWYSDHPGGSRSRSSDSGLQRLPINEDSATTLYCSARGRPAPYFKWEVRQDQQWLPWVSQQNVTLPANTSGIYSCVVDQESSASLRSASIIIGYLDLEDDLDVIVLTDADVTKRAGGYGTVFAVTGSLVVVAGVLVAGVICQRKRGGISLVDLRNSSA